MASDSDNLTINSCVCGPPPVQEKIGSDILSQAPSYVVFSVAHRKGDQPVLLRCGVCREQGRCYGTGSR